jgi:hypothetical protein
LTIEGQWEARQNQHQSSRENQMQTLHAENAALRAEIETTPTAAACFGCGRLFVFNPVRVPNVRGEPICAGCIARANPMRKANGLEPIIPASDAYEPCNEDELWN